MTTIINLIISTLLVCTMYCSMSGSKCIDNYVGEIERKTAQIDTVKLSMNVDNVEVEADFLGWGYRKSFILYISDSEIKKVDYSNKKDITIINSMNLKNELIDYINKFFIDKTEKAIDSKTKRGWNEAADYPIIRVTGFHDNKEIFNNKIRIGDEIYDIVYNPEFLKFYELLDSMAMTQ